MRAARRVVLPSSGDHPALSCRGRAATLLHKRQGPGDAWPIVVGGTPPSTEAMPPHPRAAGGQQRPPARAGRSRQHADVPGCAACRNRHGGAPCFVAPVAEVAGAATVATCACVREAAQWLLTLIARRPEVRLLAWSDRPSAQSTDAVPGLVGWRGPALLAAIQALLPDVPAPAALTAPAVAAPVPAGGALTKRERVVLRLVAAGLSNQELAATLHLSERTVERHIANIYAKLGLHGKSARAAAAHLAVTLLE